MNRKNDTPAFSPHRILIEQSVLDSELVRRVVEKCPSIHTEIIDDAGKISGKTQNELQGVSWKKALLLARQRGPFIQVEIAVISVAAISTWMWPRAAI